VYAFYDFANVTYACARCGVHFHHVYMAAFHDGHTVFALATWFCCWAALTVFSDTVHAFGDDPRGGGFPCSADTGHDERLCDPISGKGVFQGSHHGILANEICKGLGAVFAGEDLVLWGVGFGHERRVFCRAADV